MPECTDLVVAEYACLRRFLATLAQSQDWIGRHKCCINSEAKYRGHQCLHAIGKCRLVGSDQSLSQSDHIGATDTGVIAPAPTRQDVKAQIAFVLFRGALEAAGVLLEIAIGQRGECPCRGFAFVGCRITTGRDLPPQLEGTRTRVTQHQVRIATNRDAFFAPGIPVSIAEGKRLATGSCDAQLETWTCRIADRDPAGPWCLGAANAGV